MFILKRNKRIIKWLLQVLLVESISTLVKYINLNSFDILLWWNIYENATQSIEFPATPSE